MLPLIGKDVMLMNEAELAEFISARRAARLVTPGRKTSKRTVAALAQTWGVSPEVVVAAAEKEMKNVSENN